LASLEDIWSNLTQAERDKFLKALQDPSSELAQELLASEELEKERLQPWWEAPALDDDDRSSTNNGCYAGKPKWMEIPRALVKGSNAGIGLVRNCTAIWFAPLPFAKSYHAI